MLPLTINLIGFREEFRVHHLLWSVGTFFWKNLFTQLSLSNR